MFCLWTAHKQFKYYFIDFMVSRGTKNLYIYIQLLHNCFTGRAELIIDVESTTGGSLVNEDHPYLHLLMPLRKDTPGDGHAG